MVESELKLAERLCRRLGGCKELNERRVRCRNEKEQREVRKQEREVPAKGKSRLLSWGVSDLAAELESGKEGYGAESEEDSSQYRSRVRGTPDSAPSFSVSLLLGNSLSLPSWNAVRRH